MLPVVRIPLCSHMIKILDPWQHATLRTIGTRQLELLPISPSFWLPRFPSVVRMGALFKEWQTYPFPWDRGKTRRFLKHHEKGMCSLEEEWHTQCEEYDLLKHCVNQSPAILQIGGYSLALNHCSLIALKMHQIQNSGSFWPSLSQHSDGIYSFIVSPGAKKSLSLHLPLPCTEIQRGNIC